MCHRAILQTQFLCQYHDAILQAHFIKHKGMGCSLILVVSLCHCFTYAQTYSTFSLALPLRNSFMSQAGCFLGWCSGQVSKVQFVVLHAATVLQSVEGLDCISRHKKCVAKKSMSALRRKRALNPSASNSPCFW